jgi:integrase
MKDNKREQVKSGVSSKSVREMSGDGSSKMILGKGDARYWQQKGKLMRDERYPGGHLTAKIQVGGRRESFPLHTAIQLEAAKRAARIFGDVTSMGWAAALAKHKPVYVKAKAGATVGALIEAVTKAAEVRPVTMMVNATAMRRIVADVLGIRDGGSSKFAPQESGRAAWRAAVDQVPLSLLTPDKVQAWKLQYVQERTKGDESKARAARVSCNSILRKARSLFSKKVLRFVSKALVLLEPLPFTNIELFPPQSMRYVGGLDVKALVSVALDELGGDPAKREEWKAFLFLLFAGLRRGELDKLRWQAVDFARCMVRIEAASDFNPKAETSLGEVPIDPELCTILRGLRATEKEAVYVLEGEASRPRSGYSHYRAERTFTRLAAWLRKHGVNSQKPLHDLRKEAGSLLCQRAGILAASRFLRHADIAITSAHYAAEKERFTVGLGGLLADTPANVVEMPVIEAKPNKQKTRTAK